MLQANIGKRLINHFFLRYLKRFTVRFLLRPCLLILYNLVPIIVTYSRNQTNIKVTRPESEQINHRDSGRQEGPRLSPRRVRK